MELQDAFVNSSIIVDSVLIDSTSAAELEALAKEGKDSSCYATRGSSAVRVRRGTTISPAKSTAKNYCICMRGTGTVSIA